MSLNKKELLIDVFEGYYYQVVNGVRKLVFMSQNMTSTGISNSQSETEVRNGVGNGLFAVLSGQKEVTVKMSENVFSFEMIAMQTGASVITGAGVGLTSPIRAVIGETKKLTLVETPLAGEVLEIYDGETLLVLTTGYTITGKEITFTTAPTASVTVMPYKFATTETSQTITINADKFAEGGELWMKGVLKDQKEKATAYIWFVFENVKPNGTFEINSASEKQAQDMAVEMKVMKNANNELYRIHRQPIATV